MKPIAVAVALLLAPLAAGQEPPGAVILRNVAPSIVGVQVLVEARSVGSERTEVSKRYGTGVVVGRDLILVEARLVDTTPGEPGEVGRGLAHAPRIKAIQVLLPKLEPLNAYVLSEAHLGFAILLIPELGGRKLQPLAPFRWSQPTIGRQLYSVSRLGKARAFAPYYLKGEAVGKVSDPVSAWIAHGLTPGLPVFLADGTPLGLACRLDAAENENRLVLVVGFDQILPTQRDTEDIKTLMRLYEVLESADNTVERVEQLRMVISGVLMSATKDPDVSFQMKRDIHKCLDKHAGDGGKRTKVKSVWTRDELERMLKGFSDPVRQLILRTYYFPPPERSIRRTPSSNK